MRTSIIAALFLGSVVVKQNSITPSIEPIDLDILKVPLFKHSILIETLANIFSTVVPNTKIMTIRFAAYPGNEADLADLDNVVQFMFQRKNYQFCEIYPQNLHRVPLQIQRHVMVISDSYEGFL